MYEMYFNICCFDNEVGGGALLGVVLARQMLLLHALLSAVHQPETNVALLLRSCVLSTLPSKCVHLSLHSLQLTFLNCCNCAGD